MLGNDLALGDGLGQAPHNRRREAQQGLKNADSLEHLDAGGLDPVRREGVAREAIPVK